MGETEVFESNVEMPAAPALELPLPASPEPQAEPANAAPEAIPEPKANAAQVRSGTWSGVESAQPYDFGIRGEAQAIATADLGFNDNFDQMIEDSGSEVLRCNAKEPVE